LQLAASSSLLSARTLGGPPDLPERVSSLGKATSCSQTFPHRQSETELSLERSFKNSLFRTEAGTSAWKPLFLTVPTNPSVRNRRRSQARRLVVVGRPGFSSEQAVFEGPLERELSSRLSMGKNLAARSGLLKCRIPLREVWMCRQPSNLLSTRTTLWLNVPSPRSSTYDKPA
jgi:hypothetical protein